MATSGYQVYASFSGEAGSKILNVGALSAEGAYLGLVLNGGGPYDELRGVAVDRSGRLYVANAYKKGSAVDVFSATINDDGYSRDYLGTLITPKSSKALLHPYGVTFDGKTLFVSSQDTNVVSSYAISGSSKKMPEAKNAAVAPYLEKLDPKGDFYSATFVASAQPVKVGKKTPPAVAGKDGGLSMEGFDAATVATESHAADAADEALSAKKQSRHSVRGIVVAGKRLYVADEAKDRIGVYGHKSGKFHGWVSATKDTSAQPNVLDKPVGVAVSPTTGVVYVGSPGNEAIFAYDPKTQELSLVISSTTSSVTGDLPSAAEALKDLSGLAFTPDGMLIFGSRTQMQLYALDPSTSTLSVFGPQLGDAPECVLVVPN
jgi:DNA-binding beta-propeller fold protein YncE